MTRYPSASVRHPALHTARFALLVIFGNSLKEPSYRFINKEKSWLTEEGQRRGEAKISAVLWRTKSLVYRYSVYTRTASLR